jgi:hypothetical protein
MFTEHTVKLRAAVAEQPPAGALPGDRIEVEAGSDYAFILPAQFSHDSPGGIGDERGTIECNLG